jgi:hypothetical protein
MTAYSSTCEHCGGHCDWIESPTGPVTGRDHWAHTRSPVGSPTHDPVIDWEPPQRRNDKGEWVTA